MKKSILIIIVLSMIASTIYSQGDKSREDEDILGRILSEVGFTRADLGYRPTGYWNRFPLDIPHKLTSFDALFEEPMKLYDYATVMANCVELYMEPGYADSSDDGLYKLVYNLGVDKRRGGFRSYSANLLPAPSGDEPLVRAVEKLFSLSDRQTEYLTFGGRYEEMDYLADVRKVADSLPDSVQIIIAELITNLADAVKWRNLAFRNCDLKDMQKAFEIRDLATTQTDGTLYYPELDDLAATIDWASLHYAALKVAAAAEKAELSLARFRDNLGLG